MSLEQLKNFDLDTMKLLRRLSQGIAGFPRELEASEKMILDLRRLRPAQVKVEKADDAVEPSQNRRKDILPEITAVLPMLEHLLAMLDQKQKHEPWSVLFNFVSVD